MADGIKHLRLHETDSIIFVIQQNMKREIEFC